MLPRIIAVIFLAYSMIFLPFWFSVVFSLLAMLYFHFFIEAVLLFLISDLIYGAREPKLFGLVFVSSMIVLVCFISLELLKKKFRLNY